MTHAPSEYDDIIAELGVQGWEVKLTSGQHWQAFSPDKTIPPIHFASSNKSYSRTQAITKLRRFGFVWPPVIARRPRGEKAAPPELGQTPPSTPPLDQEPEPMPHPTPPPFTNGAAPLRTGLSHEDRLEAFWTALKEARSFVSLTEEHLRERGEELKKAQRAHHLARREHEEAEAALVARKAEFDAEFGR